jgi:FixJ family two-component response regulator
MRPKRLHDIDASRGKFITGHGDIPMTVKAIKSGAVEFLPKPFDDEVLIEGIRAALDR